MNNKGFTLIELLLTIVILGIIIAIAVPSYNKISKSIKENQRENVINQIEVSASKYAFDTGIKIVFVEELITEGYIEANDEGNIIDPLNNEKMNCYIVEMEKKKDYFNAKFIDGEKYENNGTCDLSKLQNYSENVNIQVVNNGNIINNTSNWIRGSVTLNAYSNTLEINCDTNKCIWSSSGGAYSNGGIVSLGNINGILNTRYTFQYTVYDKDSSMIKRESSSVSLKIDNELPEITEIYTSDEFISTEYKDITIEANDGIGSGIMGYFVGRNIDCNNNSIEYIENNIFKIEENGEYTVCVKDKAGNVNTSIINITTIS